jgi:hypothetical protein
MVSLRLDGFVQPCIPTRAYKPPVGPAWVHEMRHDVPAAFRELPLGDRKKQLRRLVGKRRLGIVPRRAHRRRRRPDLPAGLQARPRRHRVEAAERALPVGVAASGTRTVPRGAKSRGAMVIFACLRLEPDATADTLPSF